MFKRIAAITFIYFCTVVGFVILSGTVIVRTETQDSKLRSAVRQLWGSKHIQYAPTVSLANKHDTVPVEVIPLESSDIEVKLSLKHRKKGLLWYSTYKVDFDGKYVIKNPFSEGQSLRLDYSFPAEGAVYDDFRFIIDGEPLENISSSSGKVQQMLDTDKGQVKTVQISYKSQGMSEWQYAFGSNINQVKNFRLVIYTDFEDIDFLEKSISPTSKERSGSGWKLTWEYGNLLTGFNIGLIMPQKLNPGPWVSRVTLAAPVSLFLFFFVLFVFTTVRKVKIHPMNYFFIGAAFFSFHLLLAYLVDHISVHLAFWICSAVSVFLVVSYMRLVVGLRFALVETAIWQLIYLVLFSYTFFFRGYTGLAITILCICTLFVSMQFTGRVDWDRIFAKQKETPQTDG
jgi:hypothetical protein